MVNFMRFQNKVIIISGVATGIGAATAQLFASEGAKVYGLDIVPPNYDNPDIYCIPTDVSEFSAVAHAVNIIYEKERRIDYLFTNAGIHFIGSIEDSSIEDLDRLISINIKGTFYLLKCVLPIMRKQNRGNIVLMGSDQCHVGKSLNAIYGLTKGAIGQLTKSTAIDYASFNIRVNCICPGTIDTPLAQQAAKTVAEMYGRSIAQVYGKFAEAQPMKRLGQPEEIAKTVAFMLSDDAGFMTGALIAVDGGYIAQ